MIAWGSLGQDIIDSSYQGIYGHSFASLGAKIGNEFRFTTFIIGDQRSPSVKLLANDNYIVTWHSKNQDGNGCGIYGQILDNIGNKIGNEFKLNAFTNYNQDSPSVASLINTNSVVVWESYTQDGNGYGIFGNIYQSDSSIVGFDTCPLNCQSYAILKQVVQHAILILNSNRMDSIWIIYLIFAIVNSLYYIDF